MSSPGETFQIGLGEWLHWMSGIPPGNNLRSRLSGMLVRNVCILYWGMLRFSGGIQLPRTGSRLTLLGESIADLLEILCLVRTDGRPTLLGESVAESCLTLRGAKVTWLCSSAEPTLVPWWIEQLDRLDNSLLPLFLMSPVISPLFRIQIFMS